MFSVPYCRRLPICQATTSYVSDEFVIRTMQESIQAKVLDKAHNATLCTLRQLCLYMDGCDAFIFETSDLSAVFLDTAVQEKTFTVWTVSQGFDLCRNYELFFNEHTCRST